MRTGRRLARSKIVQLRRASLKTNSARWNRPLGITLLAVFFGGGAFICFITVMGLAFPGGLLEAIWGLRPDARIEFQKLGNWSIALMAVVGIACGLAAFGLARQAEWGRRLAIGILVVNLLGDSLNALLRHDLRTLIGLPIGGLMIWYLARKRRTGDQSK